MQERVSALLLRSPPDSPPTPPRSPSTLHSWSGAAPLWEKSRLLDGDSTCLSDFYVPELREFFTPWVSAMVRETKDMFTFYCVIHLSFELSEGFN